MNTTNLQDIAEWLYQVNNLAPGLRLEMRLDTVGHLIITAKWLGDTRNPLNPTACFSSSYAIETAVFKFHKDYICYQALEKIYADIKKQMEEAQNRKLPNLIYKFDN